MTFQGLAPYRLRDIRRQALYGDFERINRVMSGKRITVRTDKSDNGPLAWSTKEGLTMFNSKLADDIDTLDGIVRLVGANYHELCHHRESFGFYAEHVMEEATKRHGQVGQHVWNMLEDQRIERMFLKRWSPTAPYFVALVNKWLLGSEEDKWQDLYPLLGGRTYLDPSTIDKLRVRYVDAHGEKNAGIIERAVTRYVDLGDIDSHQKADVALQCIKEVHDVMYGDPLAQLILLMLPFHSEGASGTPTEGGGASGQQQGKSGEEDATTGSGSPAKDAKDEGEGGDTSSPSGDGTEGSSASDGSGVGSGEKDDDGLRKDAEDAVSKALADDGLKQEVSNRMATVRKRSTLKVKQNLKTQNGSVVAVPAEALVTMRRTANVFRQLVLEQDPGTITHQSFGKINIRRAMHATDFDTVFDRWAPGQQDSTDMEIVILADQSNSMGGTQHRVSSALWIIQRAIESVSTSSTVTTLGYGSQSVYLAPRGKRVSRNQMRMVHAQGSATVPLYVLEEAEYIFATSQHQKGALIILTDGCWQGIGADATNGWDTKIEDGIIARIGAAGITTALAFLVSDSQARYMKTVKNDYGTDVNIRHGAAVFTDINDPAELVTFAKKIVSNLIRKGRN